MEVNKIVETIAVGLGTAADDFTEAYIKEGDQITGIDFEKLSGTLQNVVKSRIDSVSRESRDEGYGRAKKETMDQIESRLAEKYGVPKAKFDDMMEVIVSKQKETFKANPNDIRNSDIYLADIKAEKERLKELEQSFEQERNTWKSQQVQLLGQSRATSYLTQSNFALPEDQSKRENLVRLFLKDVFNDPNNRIEPEGANLKVLDKDGYPVRNDMKEPITFDDYLESKANQYFEKRTERKPASPANHSEGGKQTSTVEAPDFANNEEYIKLVDEAVRSKNKELLTALKEKYESKVNSGEIKA